MGSQPNKMIGKAVGEATDAEQEVAKLTATLMNGCVAIPAGLGLSHHQDGGFIVTGSHGFESYLGSPLACPSLKEYRDRIEYIVTAYQEHIWKLLQEVG